MFESKASEAAIDPKEARADRTRGALTDAFIAIVLEKKQLPTAVEVSQRVRCSVRTLFECFDGMQQLGIAAFDKVTSEHAPPPSSADPPASRGVRIRAVIERRAGGVETWLPVWRLAFQHDYVQELREYMEALDEQWQAAFAREFRPELEVLSPESRRNVLIALEAITHPRVWSRLRDDPGRSLDEALRMWIEAIDRLLPRPDTREIDGAAH